MGKHDEATRLHAAREEGLQQGLEQGRREALQRRHEIARSLPGAGLDVSMVALHTQLSEAEVLALRDGSLEGETAGEG